MFALFLWKVSFTIRWLNLIEDGIRLESNKFDLQIFGV